MNTIIITIYFALNIRYALQMFQQNVYDQTRYKNWIKKNAKIDIFILIMFCLNIIMITLKQNIIINILFIIPIILEITKKSKDKLPLAYTNRLKRLYITNILIFLIIGLFLEILKVPSFLILIPIITIKYYFVLIISNILKPLEKHYQNKFKKIATKKIDSMPNLTVVGITGSYGKTSSKDILYTILDENYNVLKTPNSYNTPMGLTITINKFLKSSDEIFIAEMGAYKEGEIKELCDLVKPTIGIITSIGPAHLESFKTIENIRKTKFELIENLPKTGYAILNNDDELMMQYEIKNDCQILTYGINNKSNIMASNIKVNESGTTFDVTYELQKINVTINLLGKHNVYNTLAAFAVGIALNNNLEQLRDGIKHLKPSKHRLELKNNNLYTIIDDAFNSNPIGSKNALEVLKQFSGYKIIMTPGMIELGEKQEELNKLFGEYINETVDLAILIGQKQTKPIQDGINKNKKIEVVIFNDVLEGFEYVKNLKKENKILLIENDLPDSYKED